MKSKKNKKNAVNKDVNIVAVREGDQEKPAIQKLITAASTSSKTRGS